LLKVSIYNASFVGILVHTLQNLVSDVTGTDPNVIRIANPKNDKADINLVRGQNTKMIIGNEIAGGISGENVRES
jgi:hypothetical protein